jgi:hypothetical protein
MRGSCIATLGRTVEGISLILKGSMDASTTGCCIVILFCSQCSRRFTGWQGSREKGSIGWPRPPSWLKRHKSSGPRPKCSRDDDFHVRSPTGLYRPTADETLVSWRSTVGTEVGHILGALSPKDSWKQIYGSCLRRSAYLAPGIARVSNAIAKLRSDAASYAVRSADMVQPAANDASSQCVLRPRGLDGALDPAATPRTRDHHRERAGPAQWGFVLC